MNFYIKLCLVIAVISCGDNPCTLLTANITSYATGGTISGKVKLTENDDNLINIEYGLVGVPGNSCTCTGSDCDVIPNSCGLHVHETQSCNSALGDDYYAV